MTVPQEVSEIHDAEHCEEQHWGGEREFDHGCAAPSCNEAGSSQRPSAARSRAASRIGPTPILRQLNRPFRRIE
jgi:hypothetical protein